MPLLNGARSMMMKLCITVALPLWMVAASTLAQPTSYLDEKEPVRHALVIGNSEYVTLPRLPSAKLDAERIVPKLKAMRFKVTEVPNLASVRQLEDDVLPAFRKGIEPGDLVLVFFSGHGFTYGPHNFLAPTGLKQSLKATEVADEAVSVENVQDYLEKRSPGLLLFLVDACRTIAGFVIAAPGDKNLVGKSVAEPLRGSRGVNTLVGYAARPGYIAIGSDAEDKLSLFSASLVERITAQDDDFGSVFKEVSVDVWQISGNVQQPGLFDWSNTNPILNPTAMTLERERAAWSAALESGRRTVVERFALRNSVSRFASSARQWLNDNPVDITTNRFTLISPAAVERAWRPSGERVAIAPTLGGFAFERSLPIQSSNWIAQLENRNLGVVPSGQKEVTTNSDRLMQSLLAHGTVVATADIAIRRGSDWPAPGKEVLRAGSRISVERFEKSLSGTPILVGKVPGDSNSVFLPLARDWANAVAPVELGRSLSELELSPPAKGYRDVVDASQVQSRIGELRTQKQTITWVSVAVSPSSDSRVYDGRLARATHAAHVLKKAGIDERRITVVPGANDVNGDAVRLRFFGY